MSKEQVSPKYPQIKRLFSQELREKYAVEDKDIHDVFVDELIGADCWGVVVDGVPIFNTYALYDKLGRSFGAGMIPNEQHEYECVARANLHKDKTLKEKSVDIYMFGLNTWLCKYKNGQYEFYECE